MIKEYEITQKQLDVLLDASEPVRAFASGGVWPKTPQENANIAWQALADELGFALYTVKAIDGKGDRFFTAEVLVDETV